jgi:hypothetical protein
MNAHTPGPWVKDRFGYLVGANGDRVLVADCGIGFASGHEHPERLANSRLIEVVPDLLEALRALLPFAEHSESCGDHDAYNGADVPTCGCGLDSTIAFVRDTLIKATGEPA